MQMALSAARPAALSRLRTADAAAGSDEHRSYEPDTIALDAVVARNVSWLWPGRVPFAKLTILDGDPGLGKSSVALDVIARLTCGLPMPLSDPATALPPAKAILLSAEDGLDDTIRPRSEVAGARLGMVIAFNAMTVAVPIPGESGTRRVSRPVGLPFDIPALEKVINEHQAKLVVIDPLMAYLDESVQVHNDQSVRRALMPLGQMAERSGAAVLVVRHLNKQPGKNVIYRGGGSIGIIGAVRSGLIVCKNPEAPHERLLGVSKSNLCKPAKTLRFQLDDSAETSRVRWLDECAIDMDELFVQSEEAQPGAGAEAEDFLSQRLADGEAEAAAILAEAAALKISERTLRRAKGRLNVQARFEAGDAIFPGKWWWFLPAA